MLSSLARLQKNTINSAQIEYCKCLRNQTFCSGYLKTFIGVGRSTTLSNLKGASIVPCGLGFEALETINFLYKSRCLRSNRGQHEDELKKWFRHKSDKKTFNRKFKDVLQQLLTEGYLTKIGKSPPKYFISKIPQALFALNKHDYKVTTGRLRS
jgi:hypothetical protein